jgi:thiazolylpeptide-type bacteriocin precursor
MKMSDMSFEDLDIDGLSLDDLEVVSLKEALALPETGASSGISSTNSCSCCGSSSTCGSCQKAVDDGTGEVYESY